MTSCRHESIIPGTYTAWTSDAKAMHELIEEASSAKEGTLLFCQDEGTFVFSLTPRSLIKPSLTLPELSTLGPTVWLCLGNEEDIPVYIPNKDRIDEARRWGVREAVLILGRSERNSTHPIDVEIMDGKKFYPVWVFNARYKAKELKTGGIIMARAPTVKDHKNADPKAPETALVIHDGTELNVRITDIFQRTDHFLKVLVQNGKIEVTEV